MLPITFKHADILDEPVDIILSTANPYLQMTGGVNGAIYSRGELSMQQELLAHDQKIRRKIVDPRNRRRHRSRSLGQNST